MAVGDSDAAQRFRYGRPMSDVRALASAETEIVVPPERLCRVLELAITDSPLEQTLGELIGIVESTSRTGVHGSILLLDQDGKHLRHGAAPSLPDAYCAAIDGAEIGPCVGSCGTAADRAEMHGLRACWSIPIMTAGRRVLGTFAMYHREPREPTVRDLALVDLVTQTAALVIDRDRGNTALRSIARMTN